MASAALAGEVVAIAGEGNTDKLALAFNMLEEDQQNDVLSLKQDALYHALLRVRGALWEPLQPCSHEASTSTAASGFVAAADYAASRSGVAVLVPAATSSTSNGQQEQLQQQEQLHRNAPGIYGTPAVISGGVVGPRVGVFLRCMYTPALTLATRCGAPHLLLTPLLRREIPSLRVLTFPASDAAYLLPLYRSWCSQHEPVQQQQPPQNFHQHSTPQQQQAQQQHWQRQQQQKEGELKEKNFREGGHVFLSPPVCDMRGFVCQLTAADVLPQHATELTPDDVSATRSSPRGRRQMTTAAAAVPPEAPAMPSAAVSSVGPSLAAGVPACAAAPHLPPAGDVNEGPQQQQEENARLVTKKSMCVKGGCSSTDYTARGDNLPNNSNSSNSNSRSNSRSSSSSRECTSAAVEHDVCGVSGSRRQQQRQERERATGEDSSGAGQGGRQAGRVGGRGTPVKRKAEAHLEVRCPSGKVELTGRLLAAAATALQAHVVTAPCGEIHHQQPAVTAACWSSNDVSISIKNSTHCSSENSSVHEAVVCDRGRGVGQQRQPQQQEQQGYEHREKENEIHAQTEKRKTQELQQQQHVNAVRDWRWRGIAQKRDRKTLQTGEDILVDLLLHLRSEGKRRLPASFASELLRGTQAACGSSSCCDNAPHHSRGSTCRDNIDSEVDKNGSASSNSGAKNNSSSSSSDLQGDGGHCGVLCCCHLGPPYVHGDPEIHWMQQQQECSIDTSGDAAAQQRGRPVHASAASASSDSDSRRGSLLLPPRIPHVVATLQGGSSLPLREYISKRFQQLLLLLSPTQQQQKEQQQQQYQQDSVALNGDPAAGASVRGTAAHYSPAAASCTGDSTSALPPPPPPAAAAVNVAAQCGVSGVLVGGISAAACLEERHLLFAAALQHVPVSLPRFVSLREQAGGPLEILHAFCCGADVVEAAAVYVHSNQGLMYAFNPLLLIEEEPCCVGHTGNNSSSNETGSYDEDNSRISSSDSSSRRETPRQEGFRGKTETEDTAEAAAAARHLLEAAVKQRGPLQFLHSNLNEMLHRDDLTPLCAVTTSPSPSWSSNGHRKRSNHSGSCTETDIEISDLSSSVRSSSSGISQTGDSNRIVRGSTVRESRAYIHHLLQTREMSGPALLLQHNLQILEALAFCFRTALQQRRLLSFVQAFLARCCFPSSPSPSPPAPLLQKDPTAAAATDQ